MELIRHYRGKDVEMLTACAVIVENAIANQDFLSEKRKIWEPPYFENLKSDINNISSNYLGIDNAIELRNATRIVIQIQDEALFNLSEIKIQIQEDFKNEKPMRDEILKVLGFTSHYKRAVSRDQEALAQLLFTYNHNLSNSIKNQLIDKGIQEELIDKITNHADELALANINQETFKGTRKVITRESVEQFNNIYDQVISIAKIARNLYKGNTAIQDMFSYGKICKMMNAYNKQDTEE